MNDDQEFAHRNARLGVVRSDAVGFVRNDMNGRFPPRSNERTVDLAFASRQL
jgi:hypothetical protein